MKILQLEKLVFLLRYCDETFKEKYLSTVGIDYRLKSMTIKNDKNVKVQIWDTAGQERFRTLAKNYYKVQMG